MELNSNLLTRFISTIFPESPKNIFWCWSTITESCFVYSDEDNLLHNINIVDDSPYEDYIYSVKYGRNKIVFIFEEFDEVIKIDLNGTCGAKEVGKDLILISPLFSEKSIEKEISFYNKAEKIRSVLLKNRFRFKYGGINIYTQKKISQTHFEKYRCEEPQGAYDLENFIWRCGGKNKDILREFYLQKGLEYFIQPEFLLEILQTHTDGEQILKDLYLKDLHSDNYGYLNGIPFIFDYEGGINK